MIRVLAPLLLLGACVGYDEARVTPHGPPPQTYVCDGGKEFVLTLFVQDDVLRVSVGARSYTLFARKAVPGEITTPALAEAGAD